MKCVLCGTQESTASQPPASKAQFTFILSSISYLYTQSETTSGRGMSCFALFFSVCVVPLSLDTFKLPWDEHSLYGLRTNM